MRTNRALVAVPTALLSVGLVAGCGGGSSKSASSATDSAKGAASSATQSAGASSSGSSDSSVSCPSTNSKKFAKTRFATDVGLAAGTFHRYIYKPYKKGSFTKGHIDKSDALKAAIAAGVDYKLLKNASENAKANPTLCNKVAQPLSDAMSKLKNVDKSKLLTGDVSGLAGAESGISSLLKGSSDSGNKITQSDSLSKAKSLVGSN